PHAASLTDAPPISMIPDVMQSDVHPPLYFLLLRLWEDVFGQSDAACRSMSAVINVLGILVIFDIGRILAGPRVGLWAALIMTVAQPQIIYSHDARPYALACLLVLLAADATVRIDLLGPSARRFAVLAASVSAACLTHYFALPAIAALAVYGAIRLRGRARWNLILAYAISGLLVVLLWGRHFLEQWPNFSLGQSYWSFDPPGRHVAICLERLCVLPLRYLAEPPAQTVAAAALAGSVYILPWLLWRRLGMVLIGLWMTFPAALLCGLDLARGTNQIVGIRYSLAGSPAVYLLFAMVVGKARYSWLLPALACGACVVGFQQTFERINTDFRGAARSWIRAASPQDPLAIACGGWNESYGGLLYLGVDHYASAPPQVAVFLDSPPSAELDERLKKYGHVWLLMAWGIAPGSVLPGWGSRKIQDEPGTAVLYEMSPRSGVTD
ncbi:MAG TPA: glycosyltransferase family 39 protein, partial [Tepidisphaeraceae bacterium]|nr:glycosyltransferase family 39 protein [Tepidisphaeraceae bacterium]